MKKIGLAGIAWCKVEDVIGWMESTVMDRNVRVDHQGAHDEEPFIYPPLLGQASHPAYLSRQRDAASVYAAPSPPHICFSDARQGKAMHCIRMA
jgi:hypothetical protein